jgi:uncharacterized membrane protein YozB (DUF420 family)
VLAEALPFAFAAALYPPAMLIMAYLLSRDRPLRRSLAFLAGAAFLTLLTGGVGVVLLRGTGLDSDRRGGAPPVIDVLLGVALLIVAVVVARRPTATLAEQTRQRHEMSLRSIFVLGMVMYIPSMFYLSALHSLAQGGQSTWETVIYVVVVAVIVLSFVEVPLVLYAVAPERTGRALAASNAWLSRHRRTIVVAVAAVVGAYLLLKGIAGIAD